MGAQYDALRAVAQQTADQGREQAVLGDIHALIDEIQAKAESFTLVRSMPMASQAISSSRRA